MGKVELSGTITSNEGLERREKHNKSLGFFHGGSGIFIEVTLR
jgi:hypothetical protein